MVLANELFEQLIGTLEMVLGHARVIQAIQIGNRINRGLAQCSPHRFGNWLVRVVLLHASRCRIERCLVAGSVNHQAGHGQCQGVRTGMALHEP